MWWMDLIIGIIAGIIAGIISGFIVAICLRCYIKRMGLIKEYKCQNPECKKWGLYIGEGGKWCCFCGQPASQYKKFDKRGFDKP